MDRVPQVVLSFLRISRETASNIGMLGCGIQLNEMGEYDWSETTITLSIENEAFRCFAIVEGISFSNLPGMSGRVRIGVLQFEEYMKYHDSIAEFLQLYYNRRVIRLGPRFRVSPWELNSHDWFMIHMSQDDFERKFVSDPRIHLTTSEILRGGSLHAPCMLTEVPELSGPPRRGGWIRTNFSAAT